MLRSLLILNLQLEYHLHITGVWFSEFYLILDIKYYLLIISVSQSLGTTHEDWLSKFPLCSSGITFIFERYIHWGEWLDVCTVSCKLAGSKFCFAFICRWKDLPVFTLVRWATWAYIPLTSTIGQLKISCHMRWICLSCEMCKKKTWVFWDYSVPSLSLGNFSISFFFFGFLVGRY